MHEFEYTSALALMIIRLLFCGRMYRMIRNPLLGERQASTAKQQQTHKYASIEWRNCVVTAWLSLNAFHIQCVRLSSNKKKISIKCLAARQNISDAFPKWHWCAVGRGKWDVWGMKYVPYALYNWLHKIILWIQTIAAHLRLWIFGQCLMFSAVLALYCCHFRICVFSGPSEMCWTQLQGKALSVN